MGISVSSVNRDVVLLTAEIAHEANKRYCESIGDTSQPPWSKAPEWQKESVIAGVYFHLNNPSSTARDSHDSWYHHKLDDGWHYGPTEDPVAKTHPCMVPFDELPEDHKIKDHIYRAVVHAALNVLTFKTVL